CSHHPSVVVSGLWISGHDIHSRIYPQTNRRPANRVIQGLSTDFRKPRGSRAGSFQAAFSRAFRRVFRYREADLQMLGRVDKCGPKGWNAGCSQARQAGRPAPSFTKLNRALATRSRGKLVSVVLWQQCMEFLRDELPSQQFNTWIRPLQVEGDHAELRLYAPNRFVLDWVND